MNGRLIPEIKLMNWLYKYPPLYTEKLNLFLRQQ